MIQIIEDQDTQKKKEWDPNLLEGQMEKEISEDAALIYMKTKKIAVVSSRDQYLVAIKRLIPADQSPNGKRIYILAAKS